MVNYAKRFLIVFVLAICIGLLFFAGRAQETLSHMPVPALVSETGKASSTIVNWLLFIYCA